MQKKRMTAAFITVILVLASFTASAEWQSAGYDTRDLDNIGKIYNEVIDGHYTSKQKTDALPESAIEWREEGYERAYPHAGYSRLYLEGQRQEITRYNNLFPQWETRFKDYFWELYGDHKIYQRQQTNIPGIGWEFDYSKDEAVDSRLFVPTNRYESDVTVSFRNYGVGPFNLDGYYVSDEAMAMYERFGVDDFKDGRFAYNENKDIISGPFTAARLSELDAQGHYVVSDAEIAGQIAAIAAKYYTGPNYVGGYVTKVGPTEYLKHGEKWSWDSDTLIWGAADISWTEPAYEMEEPYEMYQYLIVNGLVFDGRNDLPRIWRYTGGKATPTVEWKYAFAEKDYPYNVVEQKYVDGKPAIENGEPVYRIPTGEYANDYIKVTETEIQQWLKDEVNNVKIHSESRVGPTDGYYAGYMGGASFIAN